jgi:carotenoid cleavage dioxygenase-like enzyme
MSNNGSSLTSAVVPSAENPYLSSGNFAPMTGETTAADLRVRGQIPKELSGRLVRIGPSPIQPRDPAFYHWFTGTGLVHALRLRGGRAEWYRSRFTLSTDAAEELGKAPISGPGEPHLSVNTSVMLVNGRGYAIVEAGANPIEFDYELNSIARADFGGTLEGGFTAHPKGDPATGELVAIAYDPSRPTLRYVVIDRAGRAETRADIPMPHRPMVHDVEITRNFIVVLDMPVTLQPEIHPGHPFPYLWNANRPARVGLLPRSGDLEGLEWFEVPPCFVFHIVNSYEEGGEVVVDVVRHPRSFDRNPLWPDEGPPNLVRWTLNLTNGQVTERILDEHRGEFPRINDSRSGQNYRYTYSAHWWGDRLETAPAYKHDVRNGRTEVRDFGPCCAALEPVFVPRAGATEEDDGYVMAYVYNGRRTASDVVIWSARDFTGPALAIVELPVRVPFGFHGDWFPDDAAQARAGRP